MLRVFQVSNEDQRENLERELAGQDRIAPFFDTETEDSVRAIIRDVAQNGDKALLEFTRRFDGVTLTPENLKVRQAEYENIESRIDPAFIEAFQKARDNITDYHSRQKARNDWFKKEDKNFFYGEVFHPMEKIGAYIPGGSAPLISTLLMTCIPTNIAGVHDILVATPPAADGTVNPYILYACKMLEVNEVYRVGGAQAIAALAFGTETVKKVDKICGPGNKYVTEAKRQVFGYVGIDMLAGPSEVCIVADKSADAEFIAADILSQAEHDPESRAILVTDSDKIAYEVCECLSTADLTERGEILEQALKHSLIILTEDMEQAFSFVQEIAPEHLEIMIASLSGIEKRPFNAGAVFLGQYTPVVIGDLYAGPNHVLPTQRRARFFSPLGVYDFLKRSSRLYYSREKLMECARDIMKFAEIEQLPWHNRSVSVRINKDKQGGRKK